MTRKYVRHKPIKRGHNINTKSIVLDTVTAGFLSNMRSIRKKLGLTQLAVANQANIQRNYISHYETGREKPVLAILIKLAEILNTDISDSVNYKFFYGKIRANKLRKSMRFYGLSLVEIASITGYSVRAVGEAASVKPSASLQCLHDLLELLHKERRAFVLRQHLTQVNGGDK